MAYSFCNQNMSTLSNILIIHTALDKGEAADYGKFVVTNSISCLRIVLADGTISSSKVTLTAAVKGKRIIDGTLDIECNY